MRLEGSDRGERSCQNIEDIGYVVAAETFDVVRTVRRLSCADIERLKVLKIREGFTEARRAHKQRGLHNRLGRQ